MSKNRQQNSFFGWYNGFLSQFGLNNSLKNVPNSVNPSFQQKEFSDQKLSVNSNWAQSTGQQKIRQEPTRMGSNAIAQVTETSKQQVISITYEEIGLFPRSFNRVFDRFFKQLFFDVENLVIQEYRFYRYLFLTTVKCLFILISVPLLVNFCSKNYLIRPITEYYWNSQQHEIFLNSYMQKRAFNELKDFEEKIYFESLLLPSHSSSTFSNFSSLPNTDQTTLQNKKTQFSDTTESSVPLVHIQNPQKSDFASQTETTLLASSLHQPKIEPKIEIEKGKRVTFNNLTVGSIEESIQFVSKKQTDSENHKDVNHLPKLDVKLFQNQLNIYIQKGLQRKTLELATHYNEESVEAITNFFADLLSFATLCVLISYLEIQINITKSFLLEVFFGLDDSKKSLLILFVTDFLVGYHSANIWELFFSSFFDHYGLPENETTIFLLVGTLPVLLDVLFKYLIFRHLNRASPATVATYHAMIE
nr:chloroplast envelope membrane protein [Follicularia botryoides]